jgi:hypothetical protein
MTDPIAALAHPKSVDDVTEDELNTIWNCSGIADEYGNHTGNIFEFARAAIALDRSRRAPQAADGGRQPSGYAYRYQQFGYSVIRFNGGGEVNGSRPTEAIPYWLGEPLQPVQAAGGEVFMQPPPIIAFFCEFVIPGGSDD